MNALPERPTPPATPALDGLLAALSRRIRRGVWLHGLGTVLVATVLWLAWCFVADWVLRVPGPIRLFHTLVLVGLVGFFVWRDLVRPLRRVPGRAGLAVLIEREHPELHQVLVSAVQLKARWSSEGRALADADPELVARVIAEAEERARGLSPDAPLAPSGPRRRLAAGTLSAVAVLLLGLAFPLHGSIFLEHLFGGHRSWPQRTHLTLEIPELGEGAEVLRTDELVRVRVARGTDVPVIVRAEGVVPDEVLLSFEGGRDILLGSTGAGVFRTLLRSLQEDVAFRATGGDDRDGLPRVEVEVLQPPDLGGLAIAVAPPEYAGIEPEIAYDRDVEVLVGSRLTIIALPVPAGATGIARVMPEDRVLALVPAPWPARPDDGTPGVAESGAPVQGLAFELLAERSLGFRIELVDEKGLSNPDPGLFRVQVVEDRAPDVQLLAPARGEVEIVPGGALSLRARIGDDFGIAHADWTVLAGGGNGTPVRAGEFQLVPLPREDEGERAQRVRELALAVVRIEVNDLGTEQSPVTADQRFELFVGATDNRAPEPNEGRSFSVRARVVTPEELLRRMQDRLGQARLGALRLSDLQREKRARTEEIFAAIDGDEPARSLDGRALSGAIAGERRVVADAQSLAQDLAGVTADVLYARIDEKADALLVAYDERMASVADPRFQAAPWRDIARALDEGRLSSGGFAGQLVQLVERALAISEDGSASALAAMEEADRALDAAARSAAIERAIAAQDATLAEIDALVAELAEWDNFQNVLQLTRDILNRQKSLRERTESFAKGKERER